MGRMQTWFPWYCIRSLRVSWRAGKETWMVRCVTFQCRNIRLEGRLHLNPGSKKGVVITHPHPLYGGNMDNAVVLSIADAFYDAGFSTLRFNFRGTGNSSGMFDDGAGEQDDVRAALAYLTEHHIPDLYLAGYSFGSWVNAHVVSSGITIQDHVMVSPPAAFISFDSVDTLNDTGLVITGQDDDIAPADQIHLLLDRLGISPSMIVLDSCDHFYTSSLKRLRKALDSYLT